MILRRLSIDDEIFFLSSLEYWDEKDINLWYASEWKNIPYKSFLKKLESNSNGIDLPAGIVSSTTLYAFDNTYCTCCEPNTIVGRLSIRHALTENLLIYGGNVGYAVAERFRRCGYATQMLTQALPIAKELGLDRLLLTCEENNIGSYKVIERCGGKLQDIIEDVEHNRRSRRYWIKL